MLIFEHAVDAVQEFAHHGGHGRWLSPDPAGLGAVDLSNPQSLNRYAYVMNNPLSFVDPLGLRCIKTDDGGWADDGTGGGCAAAGVGADGQPTNAQTTTVVGTVGGGGGGGSAGGVIIVYGPYLGGIFGGPLGGGPPGGWGRRIGTALHALKKKVCGALPEGRTMAISGSTGGAGNVSGSLELVMNYKSGQVSGFASGGVGAGWNGAAQASVSTSFIWGDLKADNTGYSGGFTTGSASGAVAGVFLSASSGGVAGNPANLTAGGVKVVGVSAGVNLLGTAAFDLSATQYSAPVSLGKYWAMADPLDLALNLAQEACQW